MMFMPFNVLGIWLRGLFSVALLVAGLGLLRDWYNHRHTVVHVTPAGARSDAVPDRDRPAGAAADAPSAGVDRVEDWHFGLNPRTAELLAGLAMTACSLGGGWLAVPLFRKRGADEPRPDRGGEVRTVRRPDGSALHVEMYGPADAPPLVMTHGWGCNATEWYYSKKELAGRYRLIVWDLPGLGLSTRPADNDWSLEKLAADLDAVLDLAGGRPAVLLGHSIGGMITLTFCRLNHGSLGTRVSGLVLAHTTYTNPVKTTKMAGLYEAIQKPVLEPLCYLMTALAPLVWLMNWMSYVNGSLQRSTDKSSFSGRETYGQLDFASRFMLQAWPAVVARGMLAMFKYDATATLPTINVPTLVVAGDLDDTTRPEASETMRQQIPGATLATLSPAKHLGLLEHHKDFETRVAQFAAAAAATPAV